MGWLIDWITGRIYQGWLDEIECWQIHRMEGLRSEVFIVTDQCRGMNLCVEPGEMVPDKAIMTRDFQTRKEAESFIDYMCARAAAIHLIKFWRD